MTSNEQRGFTLTSVESRADLVALLQEIKAAAAAQVGTQQLIEVRDYVHPAKSDLAAQGYTVRLCTLSVVENGASIRSTQSESSPRYNVGGLTVEFVEVNATVNAGYTAAAWN